MAIPIMAESTIGPALKCTQISTANYRLEKRQRRAKESDV